MILELERVPCQGWCYAMGDQVILERSERMVPVIKELEVESPHLWEGVRDDETLGGTKMTPGVGDGTRVIHLVWVIKAGQDTQVVDDGQVVGQWEVVEDSVGQRDDGAQVWEPGGGCVTKITVKGESNK